MRALCRKYGTAICSIWATFFSHGQSMQLPGMSGDDTEATHWQNKTSNYTFPYAVPWDNNQACNIWGASCQTGSIVVNITAAPATGTGRATATVPCSSYLSAQNKDSDKFGVQWAFNFGRSPECRSMRSASHSGGVYTLSGCPASNGVGPVVTAAPGTFPKQLPNINLFKASAVSECCGACGFQGGLEAKLHFFPSQADYDECDRRKSNVSASVSASAAFSRQTGIWNRTLVTPHTETVPIVIDGYTMTPPTMYLQLVDPATVFDKCGSVGSPLTNGVVVFPPGHLSTMTGSFRAGETYEEYRMTKEANGKVHFDKFVTAVPLNSADLICPTFGVGVVNKVTTIGPPYLPMIYPPKSIVSLQPEWQKVCDQGEFDNGGIEPFAILDPPVAHQGAAQLVPNALQALPAQVTPEASHEQLQGAEPSERIVPLPSATPVDHGSSASENSQTTNSNGDKMLGFGNTGATNQPSDNRPHPVENTEQPDPVNQAAHPSPVGAGSQPGTVGGGSQGQNGGHQQSNNGKTEPQGANHPANGGGEGSNGGGGSSNGGGGNSNGGGGNSNGGGGNSNGGGGNSNGGGGNSNGGGGSSGQNVGTHGSSFNNQYFGGSKGSEQSKIQQPKIQQPKVQQPAVQQPGQKSQASTLTGSGGLPSTHGSTGKSSNGNPGSGTTEGGKSSGQPSQGSGNGHGNGKSMPVGSTNNKDDAGSGQNKPGATENNGGSSGSSGKSSITGGNPGSSRFGKQFFGDSSRHKSTGAKNGGKEETETNSDSEGSSGPNGMSAKTGTGNGGSSGNFHHQFFGGSLGSKSSDESDDDDTGSHEAAGSADEVAGGTGQGSSGKHTGSKNEDEGQQGDDTDSNNDEEDGGNEKDGDDDDESDEEGKGNNDSNGDGRHEEEGDDEGDEEDSDDEEENQDGQRHSPSKKFGGTFFGKSPKGQHSKSGAASNDGKEDESEGDSSDEDDGGDQSSNFANTFFGSRNRGKSKNKLVLGQDDESGERAPSFSPIPGTTARVDSHNRLHVGSAVIPVFKLPLNTSITIGGHVFTRKNGTVLAEGKVLSRGGKAINLPAIDGIGATMGSNSTSDSAQSPQGTVSGSGAIITSAPARPDFLVNGIDFEAPINGSGKFVMHDGTPIAAGGSPVTIDGTSVSLDATGTLTVGTTAVPVPTPPQKPKPAPFVGGAGRVQKQGLLSCIIFLVHMIWI